MISKTYEEIGCIPRFGFANPSCTNCAYHILGEK